MTTFKDCAPALYKNGYEVLPIKVGEKRPAVDDWADIELTKEVLTAWHGNCVAAGGAGIRLGNGVVALDIDVDDDEVAELVQDCADLVLGTGPVRVGSAPRCAVLYAAEGLTKRVLKLIDPLGSLHKVELLGKGQQVVAYGIHPDTGKEYQWVGESPLEVGVGDLVTITGDEIGELFDAVESALPDGWRVERSGGQSVAPLDELQAFVENNPDRLDLTDDEVVAAIDAYSVPSDYDGWLRFMLACYHQSGGSDVGLEWAHRGCRGLSNYDKKEIDRKWRSGTLKAKGDRKPVTFASVMAEVGEVLRTEKTVKSLALVDKIKAAVVKADDKELRTVLVEKIKRADLDDIDREIIVKAVQERIKQVSGASVAVGAVRSMLKPKSAFSDGCGETPEWCKDWVYVNSHDGMFSLDDRQVYKVGGFNIICGKHVPMSENGSKPSAVKFVSDHGYLDTVEAMAYLPGITDVLCTLPNGARVVNSFDHRSVPVAVDKMSDEGTAAVEVIRRHLRVLCGSEQDALVLEQWLAHQVQNPGVKLLWAPLIQSIQGVGKSFVASLLRSAMGSKNVGTVSPSQVISDNNGWATGVCVNVLEELKIAGHNRHEAANALKPLITDEYIQVHDKYVKAHLTYNTANYICFTNHKDSVPLEDEDRRWWVIFCEIESLDEIGVPFGLSRHDYFEALWSALRGHGGCIRRWLLDYQITAEFSSLTKAPDSIYKQSMIATERSSVEYLDEIAELIATGGKNFNRDVVCSADLFTAAEFEIDGFLASTSQRNLILKKLGYTQLPKQLKIDGRAKRVWVRKVVDADKARELLHPVPF